MTRALSLLLVTLLSLCVGAAPAWPRSAGPYQSVIDAAHTAFEVGDYDRAITSFRRAYALRRDARLLYNLALSHYKRHVLRKGSADLVQADDLFRRFLLLATPHGVPAGQRRQLRQVRGLARDYLAEIARRKAGGAAPHPITPHPTTPHPTTPHLTTPRPTSPRPTSPRPTSVLTPTSLPAPPADLAAKPPLVPASRPLELSPASSAVVAPTRRGSRLYWLVHGVAAACAVAAGITGGLALSAEGDAEQLALAGDLAGNHSRADAARRYAVATDTLISVAVVSAVVGIIWHWRARAR